MAAAAEEEEKQKEEEEEEEKLQTSDGGLKGEGEQERWFCNGPLRFCLETLLFGWTHASSVCRIGHRPVSTEQSPRGGETGDRASRDRQGTPLQSALGLCAQCSLTPYFLSLSLLLLPL